MLIRNISVHCKLWKQQVQYQRGAPQSFIHPLVAKSENRVICSTQQHYVNHMLKVNLLRAKYCRRESRIAGCCWDQRPGSWVFGSTPSPAPAPQLH